VALEKLDELVKSRTIDWDLAYGWVLKPHAILIDSNWQKLYLTVNGLKTT
jgi:hypothetical protein